MPWRGIVCHLSSLLLPWEDILICRMLLLRCGIWVSHVWLYNSMLQVSALKGHMGSSMYGLPWLRIEADEERMSWLALCRGLPSTDICRAGEEGRAALPKALMSRVIGITVIHVVLFALPNMSISSCLSFFFPCEHTIGSWMCFSLIHWWKIFVFLCL